MRISARRVAICLGVILVVGGILLTSGGVTHAGRQDRNSSPPNPLREIIDKLDNILDHLRDQGIREGDHTLRWDQVLPAADRFVVLPAFSNEAVLDKETGLVWERTPSSEPTAWDAARGVCLAKRTGGRMGLRLPSVHEMFTLVDPTHVGPMPLPDGHPFNVQPISFLWSATTNAADLTSAWIVPLISIGTGLAPKTNQNIAWCTRGGQNHSSTY